MPIDLVYPTPTSLRAQSENFGWGLVRPDLTNGPEFACTVINLSGNLNLGQLQVWGLQNMIG